MRNKFRTPKLQHVSKILVLKFCVVSHSGLLTLLPIRLTILPISVSIDKSHVHCNSG